MRHKLHLTREGWRKVKELSAGEEIAASRLMTFSMGMVLDVKGYPYSNAERQSSNEHCHGHFVSPPFLGCNSNAEINNAKHVTQRTIFTNAEKGLKNSLAIPSINIALPRSAINFATKLWYFSPIRSIAKQLYHSLDNLSSKAYADQYIPRISAVKKEIDHETQATNNSTGRI